MCDIEGNDIDICYLATATGLPLGFALEIVKVSACTQCGLIVDFELEPSRKTHRTSAISLTTGYESAHVPAFYPEAAVCRSVGRSVGGGSGGFPQNGRRSRERKKRERKKGPDRQFV